MQFIKIISNQQTTAWVNTDAVAAIEDGPQLHTAQLHLAGGTHYDVMDSAEVGENRDNDRLGGNAGALDAL